jgi:hypothetical protein
MSSVERLDDIAPETLLARFITSAKWVRQNRTVKPDAFIPPKDLQFSVTQHLNLSSTELWQIGQKIVAEISKTRTAELAGRADVSAGEFSLQNLRSEPAPSADNPNHVHVVGWPSDKPAQKIIAQELAALARFVETNANP